MVNADYPVFCLFILVLSGMLPQSSAKFLMRFPLLWSAQQQTVMYTEKCLSSCSTLLFLVSHSPNVPDVSNQVSLKNNLSGAELM